MKYLIAPIAAAALIGGAATAQAQQAPGGADALPEAPSQAPGSVAGPDQAPSTELPPTDPRLDPNAPEAPPSAQDAAPPANRASQTPPATPEDDTAIDDQSVYGDGVYADDDVDDGTAPGAEDGAGLPDPDQQQLPEETQGPLE